MNKSLLLFSLLFTLSFSNAQPINFDLADPQPDLVDVYGGSFASGDIDGDGDQDLIIGGITPASRTKLYLNDGNGNFSEVENTPIPNGGETITIFKDLDADGDLDLFFSGRVSGIGVTNIYLNDGQGAFTQIANPSIVQFAGGADVDIEDVDGDDDYDILIAAKDNNDNFVTDIYLNDGDANFTPSENTVFIPVFLASVKFIDAENDGDFDIIITGEQEDESYLTRLYLNDGDGNYTVDSNVDFVQLLASDVDVADTDNDGDMDILMSGQTESFEVLTMLYLNDGNGQFTNLTTVGLQHTFAGTNEIADLDNDGDLDMVIIGTQDGGLPNIYNIVYENLGNNQFMPVDTIGGEYIAASVVDDFNGDGLQDIIIQGFADRTNFYWNNSTVTSLSELNESKSLTIFPNPSTGNFTISLEETTTNFDLSIFTSVGKLVKEELNISGYNHELQLDLPVGTYVVYIKSDKSITTKVLVIQK